ncbi:autotransporter family protein [Rhizorhapis suberifaciens]|uniref:Uncharacterized protein with beta-barrel porin domain n=1 Tax=Rhizorhapis suberifaciens TaxID=13656 RepID=A0A840HYE1_9SPHN|nr:autotransporter outer membrane beta-barrel domain-containing protein [Rhizorhapis suberifaciens]MBB4642528.1 uncharacterized protein with beta-barrel porin domain [Rhizorhapis suberifaciens]
MNRSVRFGHHSRVMFGASLLAMAVSAQSAQAQSCPGVDGDFCVINVTAADQDVSTSGGTHIVNNATGTSITQTSNDYLLIENQVSAGIDGLSLLPQTTGNGSPLDTIIINRGTIEGDLVFANGGIYVNDGGAITGNLTSLNANLAFGHADFFSGFKTEYFINRTTGGTGVQGTIDPGNGLDVYAQSFSTNGVYALPTTLPLHFEIAGVEVLGADTVVTITNLDPDEAATGLSLLGNGSIINRATINPISLLGTGLPDMVASTIHVAAVGYGGGLGQARHLIVPAWSQAMGQMVEVELIYGTALNSFANEGVVNGDLRLNTASFTNSGEINLSSDGQGTLLFGAADRDFIFANSGTISMIDNGARDIELTDAAIALATAIDATEKKAVSITNIGEIGGGLSFQGVASDFVFDNSGTISIAGNGNDIDRAVDLEIGLLEVALNPAFQEDAAADSISVTNNATGTLDGGISMFAHSKTFTFANHGSINSDVDDPFAEAVEIELDDYSLAQDGEDEIDAESASFTNTGTISGAVALELNASVTTFNNSGEIITGLTPSTTLFAEGASAVDIEQETALGATLNFTNGGTISTSDYAGVAVGIEVEAGDLGSGVPGAENANAAVTFVNSGTIAASGGTYLTPGNFLGLPSNQLLMDLSTALGVDVDAEAASSVSIINEAGGIINGRGFAHLGLPGGPQLIEGQPVNASGLTVAARADAVSIVNRGQILGGPGGSLVLPSGVTLIPDFDDIDFEGVLGTAIDTFSSNDDITNRATGRIEGGIALRSGDDTLRNYGTIISDINFGAGDDTFIQGIDAIFTGTADGGDGADRFLLDITGGGAINNAIYDQLVNFETLGLTGTGTISSDAPLPVETFELTGDDPITFDGIIETLGPVAITGTTTNDTLTVHGTVNGDVDLGDGDNSFDLDGAVNGDVSFGSGGDTLILQPGWSISGTATGGEGHDSLSAPVTGSYEEPTEIDLAAFQSFEELNITSGGVGTVSGDLEFEEINVDDGRVIGLAGSTISGDVNVSSGGTFGSAGTVNGDIGVNGTLSPGSSPGTMTINGNVTLSSGSTTLFEMTSTVSDAIIINGGLTIQTGATIEITGERPLTPGSIYNLITTTDGITGSSNATLTKLPTVLGFLNWTSHALQLLGTFQTRSGASAQVVATADYLNQLLIGGEATAGILAAAPDLVGSDGYASDAAMATLNAEAYASISQIGVENGLAVSSALRSANFGAHDSEAGPFAFGEGFGAWRNFKAESRSGVSRADVHSAGFFGGIGYGNENVSVAAFIGHVDGSQSINSIGASNDADGTFFGAGAHLAFAGFRFGASVVRDHSSADTSRTLFNGAEATSHYRLRGTTADIHAGYGFAFGRGWDIGPEFGVTHVSVKRGAATETGGGAFSLNVAKDRISYTFLTADLALQMREGALRPWLTAGLRQRLDNDSARATASLAGVSTSFTVPGVQRDRSFANIGAGVAWKVLPALTLFTRGNSEFGSDNNAHSVDAGLKLRF